MKTRSENRRDRLLLDWQFASDRELTAINKKNGILRRSYISLNEVKKLEADERIF